MNRKLIVRDTGKYGKGVFAVEDIKKGEIMHILGGKRMGVKDFIKNVMSGDENLDDPFQIKK